MGVQIVGVQVEPASQEKPLSELHSWGIMDALAGDVRRQRLNWEIPVWLGVHMGKSKLQFAIRVALVLAGALLAYSSACHGRRKVAAGISAGRGSRS